jgi:pimeloyl-ACP methyl ester carboxylesterase
MSTFVLVHGAWHGGWCWQRVVERLEARGHRVFAPTMTGLAERAHEMSASIDLDTHIDDITGLIEREDLRGIVLVGHSYGGWVISGVAERVLPRLASVVFLDAFVPEDGQRGMDLTPAELQAQIKKLLAEGAISRPPPSAEWFGVNPADRAWVDSMTTPQPMAIALQPIRLTGARERVPKKSYIRATGTANTAFDAALAALKQKPGWRSYAVPCGHDVMIDMPDRLVEILEEVA